MVRTSSSDGDLAERLRARIEARGYEVVRLFDPDIGDVLEARMGERVVARAARFRSLEEGLLHLAGELGLPLGDPEV